MQQFLYTLVIIFGVYLISFALINIRHIFTGKKIKGTCVSDNPAVANQIGVTCSCGGDSSESSCEN